ncbi:hypothetical protein [Paenibacillus sp. USHLN196]|uniref:hypothetical protein n=1 Tax=Paenibacillus sp. USHLN196 TaxID=3081291 RepID=UPI003017092C
MKIKFTNESSISSVSNTGNESSSKGNARGKGMGTWMPIETYVEPMKLHKVLEENN